MSRATLHCGDVREVLAGLPAESVQMVCTSPPYWGLRDYGTASWSGGDPDCDHRKVADAVKAVATSTLDGGKKTTGHLQEGFGARCGKCLAVRVDRQLGLESTPGEYVEAMVAVFREVRRVLRKDGVVWLNLGDSYAANGISGLGVKGESSSLVGTANHAHTAQRKAVPNGLKPKDLVGIPWRVAFALQADGWWLRSEITWCKSAPMPESVTDRPTSATEKLFLLTKSETYFYDATAIAEPTVSDHPSGNGFKRDARLTYLDGDGARGNDQQWQVAPTKNARNWWLINPDPFPGAHFAVMPRELARRCILAGSSPRACEHCGAPWERVTERSEGTDLSWKQAAGPSDKHAGRIAQGLSSTKSGFNKGSKEDYYANAPRQETTGWQPTCSCENTGTGRSVVLDPFGGSGTVAQVATGNGRDSIYIDLNPKYLELARQRIGPMLCDEPKEAA